MDEREIGRVKKVFFGVDDRGLLSFCVDMDFGGCGQAYGHFCLDSWDAEKKQRVGTKVGCEILRRLHAFFEVDELHKAKGQAIVAEREGPGFGSLIQRLRRLDCDGGAVFDVKAIVAECGES